MSMLTRMIDELKRPDDQKNSWYDWCKNQMSHAFIGVVCTIHFGFFVSVALACLKEAGDIYREPKYFMDSMTDVALWSLGSWLIVAEDKILVSILIAFALICGTIPRLRRARTPE